MTVKVGVIGAMGRMGQEVVKAVLNDSQCELVLAADKYNEGFCVSDTVKIESDIEGALKAHKPDVVVDFTQPDTIFNNINMYLNMGIKSVIGTTGLSPVQIKEIEKLSKEKNTGCFIAPNFSTGAVLMMIFAKTAAKYFNNAEIIELHHNQKKDAPSGTAIKTAQMMAEVNDNFKSGNAAEKETIQGARGGEFKDENGRGNINIHSVRMPGFMASQEVIFGSGGQTLKIRHDSTNRECYMPGVIMAVKHVYQNNNFVYGLENIL